MKRWTIWLALLAFLVLYAGEVRAELVTIGIAGEVTYVGDIGGLLGGAVEVGDIVTGNYMYDSDTPDTNPLGQVGEYRASNEPFGVSISVAGMTFQTDPESVDLLFTVIDNYLSHDSYAFGSYNNLTLPNGVEVDWIAWSLSDYSCAALSSPALPVGPPVLDDWESNYLLITLGEKGSSSIQGTVTDVWLVPEPGTVALLGLGAVMLRRKRS